MLANSNSRLHRKIGKYKRQLNDELSLVYGGVKPASLIDFASLSESDYQAIFELLVEEFPDVSIKLVFVRVADGFDFVVNKQCFAAAIDHAWRTAVYVDVSSVLSSPQVVPVDASIKPWISDVKRALDQNQVNGFCDITNVCSTIWPPVIAGIFLGYGVVYCNSMPSTNGNCLGGIDLTVVQLSVTWSDEERVALSFSFPSSLTSIDYSKLSQDLVQQLEARSTGVSSTVKCFSTNLQLVVL